MIFLCAFKLFLLIFPKSCQEYSRTNNFPSLDFSSQLVTNETGFEEFVLPDAAKNAFVFLEEHNYYYENHTITTEDGYILLTVRIPYGKRKTSNRKRPPVIFVHGIFCTFVDFLNAGPERALGFHILEEGYDLWLMNARGNTHSRSHVTLDPDLDSAAYWNFSWHEIGYYDVPANMDYIEKVTGFSNVSIVGHSQGGTVYLALAASRPEYDRRISFSLQLAPVVYVRNAKQLILSTLKDNLDLVYEIITKYKLYEILPTNEVFTEIGTKWCHINSPLISVCERLLDFLGGPTDQQDGSLLATLVYSHPAGASAKQVLHYLQIGVSDKFHWYDYGPEENKMVYHQETPPLYNLSAITSPVAIYYGKDDYFVSLADGARMAAQIPNAHLFVLGKNTNHLDVQWGSKAVQAIFKPGIKLLNKFNRRYIVNNSN